MDERLWERLENNGADRETIYRPERSFVQDVWYRFWRRPTAILGLVLIGLLIIFALAGPFFSPYRYGDQNLSFVNIPPYLKTFVYGGRYFYITQNLKLIEVSGEGRLIASVKAIRDDGGKKLTDFDIGGSAVLSIDYSQRPPALLDGREPIEEVKSFWNKTYLLGTDNLGRDLLTRLMYGARISLVVAFVAAFVNLVIGILFGGISGLIGGYLDLVMMRIVDIIATIPLTLYVILIMVFLNSGFLSIIIALSSVYWVNMARIVRGQILSLKEQEFVLAARTIGSSAGDILMRHLIPNAIGPIIVTATMLIPTAIFVEAFMSFIGLGVSAPMASWGTMCNDAIETFRISPYQLFFPSLAICAAMFAFNFVGDGLRDALDLKKDI
ncbi:MAG: ABC transporter permease [Spirochaetaceae bacterium]|jgi:oligopeptide transport system permease protein|nr:ABC transporter permease [Spirochaetaceae bacterium]